MTKLEELKAAYEAATPGEWVNNDECAPNMAAVGTGEKGWLGLAQMFGDTQIEANANAAFIALAHNLMPPCSKRWNCCIALVMFEIWPI